MLPRGQTNLSFGPTRTRSLPVRGCGGPPLSMDREDAEPLTHPLETRLFQPHMHIETINIIDATSTQIALGTQRKSRLSR